MKRWIEPQDLPIPDDLLEAASGQPLVARALARRGVRDAQAARPFLDPEHYTPAPPEALPGLAEAAERLESALRRGEGILVWGDFDVDGQTATALLVSTLRELGGQARYHIPVRARESHGVSAAALGELLDAPHQPPTRLLLTCDTGITAHAAVEYARQRGLEVLITDHHALPPELPRAHAILNPRLLPEEHPLAMLPGVGVAYKVAEALYARFDMAGAVEQQLDLAALGIIADLAILHGEARYLAQRGIAVLRQTERLGLQEVMKNAELDPSHLTEEHISFLLAPRLNALGRLSDANPAVELLTTHDLGQARLLAVQIEGLNRQRQLLTSQVLRAALAQVERDPSLLETAALVLAHPAWPAGVIGIVASQLVERFGMPVALIAAPPGELGRASARSVPGIDITSAIAAQAEMLAGFGGHPMAAGFAIDPSRIDEFRVRLSSAVKRQGPAPEPALALDGYLEWGDLSLELAAELERLAPFGPGNPPLALATRRLRLLSHAQVGREGEHLSLTIEDEAEVSRRAIWWGGGELLGVDALPEGFFDLAYTLRASTYRGARELSVEWLDYRPCEESIELRPAKPAVQVVDYRSQPHPLPILLRLAGQEAGLQVWAEAEAVEKLRLTLPEGTLLRGRTALEPTQALAIWTSPPGSAELAAALQAAQPERVYLFAVHPETGGAQAFLRRLAGLAKHVLAAGGGATSLERLAEATAQRLEAARLGLGWLEAKGLLRIANNRNVGCITDASCRLEPGSGEVDAERLKAVEGKLRELLEEARAYRAYYSRVDAEALLR